MIYTSWRWQLLLLHKLSTTLFTKTHIVVNQVHGLNSKLWYILAEVDSCCCYTNCPVSTTLFTKTNIVVNQVHGLNSKLWYILAEVDSCCCSQIVQCPPHSSQKPTMSLITAVRTKKILAALQGNKTLSMLPKLGSQL